MGRLWRVFKGWFLGLLGIVEKANPKAILEAEIGDFHKAVGQFNQNLAKQAGMIERLKGQIVAEERKVELAKARAAAAYHAKNMGKAGQLALTVKETTRELNDNKEQLKMAEGLFADLTRQRNTYVGEAKRRIDSIKSKISKAEMAEAQARLTELASDTTFNLDGSGMSALEEQLDSRIAEAQGKTRVASEATESDPWTVTEGGQDALEAQALAEMFGPAGSNFIDAPVPASEELDTKAAFRDLMRAP